MKLETTDQMSDRLPVEINTALKQNKLIEYCFQQDLYSSKGKISKDLSPFCDRLTQFDTVYKKYSQYHFKVSQYTGSERKTT